MEMKINKEPNYKVQYEDGSWSKWGSLNETIKPNERYVAVHVEEYMTREEFENKFGHYK